MKKLLLLLSISVFACCNNAAEKEDKRVEAAVVTYITKTLNYPPRKQLDSFKVISIDSLTQRELIKYV